MIIHPQQQQPHKQTERNASRCFLAQWPDILVEKIRIKVETAQERSVEVLYTHSLVPSTVQ